MMRFICRSCLRLWPGERVQERTCCPMCGGELIAR